MKRTATMTYQTNGSSALAAQRAEFTVIEGNRRAAANRQVVQEHLSVAQMLKTGFVIVAVLAALAAPLCAACEDAAEELAPLPLQAAMEAAKSAANTNTDNFFNIMIPPFFYMLP